MSFDSQNEMNISGPIPLVRTLSEQHWTVAKLDMVQKKRKVQWAGTGSSWEYQLVRDTTKSKKVKKQTFLGEVMVCEDEDELPKATRCRGVNKDGHRCKRKVYCSYCSDHYELK